MNHIEIAIAVLREEISKLQSDLRYGRNTPDMEEAVTDKLQKLNRAVNDIQKHFGS